MQTTDRMREIARAIKDGSARPAEVLELARLVLDDSASGKAAAQRLYEAIVRHTGAELSSDICERIMQEAMAGRPEQRHLTDAELHALGALSITEAIDKEIHPTRRVTAKRLRAELERRGVLP